MVIICCLAYLYRG